MIGGDACAAAPCAAAPCAAAAFAVRSSCSKLYSLNSFSNAVLDIRFDQRDVNARETGGPLSDSLN